MSSSYRNRKTPGVYVTELPAFGLSVVGVETALPIFVGYTQTAADTSSGKPLYMQAVEINSLTDYYSTFGHGYHTQYYVADMPTASGEDKATKKPVYDFQALFTTTTTDSDKNSAQQQSMKNYVVTQGGDSNSSNSLPLQEDGLPRFNLFSAIRLFYANGGGKCYVVSVANYWGTQEVVPSSGAQAVKVSLGDLNNGLNIAYNTISPTMVVVPDACLLSATTQDKNPDGTTSEPTGAASDYSKIATRMIQESATLQSRVAILDMPGALNPTTWGATGMAQAQKYFEEAIADVGNPGADEFSYGAAYAPALEVSVLSMDDVDFTNLYGGTAGDKGDYPGIVLMNNLLTTQANKQYPKDSANLSQVLAKVEVAFPSSGVPNTSLSADQVKSTNQYLVNALPLMSQVLEILLAKLNVAPPSGIMAGIWTRNDGTRGVWNAPANYSLSSVVAPKVILTDEQQADYNVPLSGNSISILRSFPGRGTVVWGARTLDGNSNDYRYIQVRRTLIYVEQSIKQAIQPFVFAPNTGQTWVTVTSMISNFLSGLWQQGGLMGDKASDAFSVQCGLGSTMTSQDILNGYMIIAVKLQMVHPAEYIELTFTQMMQGS